MTLIDTSVIIDFIAGEKKIVNLIQELAEAEEIKTTSITEYELLKHKTKLKRQLQKISYPKSQSIRLTKPPPKRQPPYSKNYNTQKK